MNNSQTQTALLAIEIGRSAVVGDCMVWRNSVDSFCVSRDMSEWGQPVSPRTLAATAEFVADSTASN